MWLGTTLQSGQPSPRGLSTTTRIETVGEWERGRGETYRPRGLSTTTRIETRARAVRPGGHGRAAREDYPLQQGLKRHSGRIPWTSTSAREDYPLQQGLKPRHTHSNVCPMY